MPDEFVRFWHASSMVNGPGLTTLSTAQNAIAESEPDVPLNRRPKLFILDMASGEWYMLGTDPSQIPAMLDAYNARLASEGKALLPRLGIPAVRPPAPPTTVFPIAIMPPGTDTWIHVDPTTGQLQTDDGSQVRIEPGTGNLVDPAGNVVVITGSTADGSATTTPLPITPRFNVSPLLLVGGIAAAYLLTKKKGK